MAIQRRKLLAQGLNLGHGIDTIPADAGGSLVGDKIGIHTFINSYMNVSDFGASGNDSTDNTTAIQSAFSALTAAGGGVLIFPAGTFRTGTLTVPSNVKLVGQGGTSIIKFIDDGSATSRNLFISSVNDVWIDSLTFTSTAASRTGVYGLIRMDTASRIFINNCKFLVSPATAIHAIQVTDVLIQGNYISGTYADGIHISRQSKRVRIIGNEINGTADDGIGLISYTDSDGSRADNEDIVVQGNVVHEVTVGRGISVYGGRNITVTGNTVSDIDQAGIIVSAQGGNSYTTSTTHYPKEVVVSNNTVRNAGRSNAFGTQQGIYVNPARFVTVSGNIVESAGSDAISCAGVTKDIVIANNIINESVGRGIVVDATASTEARLITELFTNLGESGISTALSADITITGNSIRKATTDSMYLAMPSSNFLLGVTITGNIITDSPTTTDAIELNRVKYASVTGNRINNCTEGIRLATSSHITATGNVITNCGDGFLLLSATDNVISGNVITDHSAVGVHMDSSSSSNGATGNFFLNNTTIDIQDSGTNNMKGGNQFGATDEYLITGLNFTELVGQTLDTTFTNGTTGAMPTQFEKMLTITINGTQYKIPAVKP